jgi:hypothetical protein
VLDGRCVEGPSVLNQEEVRRRLDDRKSLPVFATESFPEFEHVVVEHPSAARLAELTLRGDGDDRSLEPIYLRGAYITSPNE